MLVNPLELIACIVFGNLISAFILIWAMPENDE